MAFQTNPYITADNVRFYRERMGISIAKLASVCFMRYQQILDLENARGSISSMNLRAVADALGVGIDQLQVPRQPEVEYQEGC